MKTIKPKSPARFKLGRQSSLAPDSRTPTDTLTEDEDEEFAAAAAAGIVDPTIRLMYLANEGDIEGINKMLDSGTNVDYRDIDGRTALHVAACQGRTDVVELLLSRGAKVNSMDRWGSTPLADAVYYKNHDVIQLLEKHGAKPTIPPMHVLTDREVPEYEIHPSELDFSNSVKISKGTFHKASWRGIDVAVKTFGEEMFSDEDKVNAFRDELALLQKIRHPNVVQFLGAVTQSNPMMIVTEYLPKGDLRQYLDRKGSLMPAQAVKFALEIARGMNYLHEHKPEAIIHCDLEPPNILRDDSGHLKVADFGISKLLVVKKTDKKDRPITSLDSSWRYMAPEVYRNEEYDTKVDVFSFALILQEMIEGFVPFHLKEETEVPKAYIEDERPPFNAPAKSYPFGLRELIQECWDSEASKRPTFREIISTLELISDRIARKMSWKCERHVRFSDESGHTFSTGDKDRLFTTLMLAKESLCFAGNQSLEWKETFKQRDNRDSVWKRIDSRYAPRDDHRDNNRHAPRDRETLPPSKETYNKRRYDESFAVNRHREEARRAERKHVPSSQSSKGERSSEGFLEHNSPQPAHPSDPPRPIWNIYLNNPLKIFSGFNLYFLLQNEVPHKEGKD
ncbi:hypothetical protein Bca101_037607 [Brassica carinata]